jgi:hypothetical protein
MDMCALGRQLTTSVTRVYLFRVLIVVRPEVRPGLLSHVSAGVCVLYPGSQSMTQQPVSFALPRELRMTTAYLSTCSALNRNRVSTFNA